MILYNLERTSLSQINKNQISSLVILISDCERRRLTEYPITTVCAHVFTVFKNLRNLNISSSHLLDFPRLSFTDKLPTFYSSTLIELQINVYNLEHCFYILDGRFDQLRYLYVNICYIVPSAVMTNNTVGYFP